MPGLRTRSALIALFCTGTLAAGQASSAGQPGQAKPIVEPSGQPAGQPAGKPAEVAPSGVQPEAREALEAATKALADANSLSFKIVSTLPQFQEARAGCNGTIEMLRRPEASGWFLRREGTGVNMAPEPMTYVVVSDGQVVSWIDHDKKIVFEKFTRSAKDRQIQAADAGSIKQLTDAQPFAKELAAPKATLEGTGDADGTPCDIVAVNFGENKENLRWYFAAADHLPRRLERTVGAFQTIYEITDLKLNPELSVERFTLATPDGYKREAVVRPTARQTPTSDETPPVIPPVHRPVPGDEDVPALRAAPAFELQSTDGKPVSLASLKGNVVVLGFWGAWQPGGKLAAPEFQGLADSYKGKPVKVLWLARKGKEPAGVTDFVREHGLTMGVLIDADAVAKDYQVRSYPGFVVIGNDGEVLLQSGGFVAGETMGEIQKAIDKYLAGDAEPVDGGEPTAPGTGNTPGGPSRPSSGTPAQPAGTAPKPK